MSLKISGLHKRYDNVDPTVPAALDDIAIEAPAGAFLTLLGPSGCGKSTLLNLISGLDRPSAGRIEIDGKTVYDSASRLFVEPAGRNISMVFQSYAIWPHMSVKENIEFPLKHGNQRKSLTPAQRASVVTHAMDRVQLGRFADRPAPMLSGGQQQRVSLARALAQKPSLILLDEPLSNLDAALREKMQKEIRSIVTEEKITAVYVTHDQKEALSMSDIVVLLKDGKVEQIGTPRQIYYRPMTRFAAKFMGSPNLLDGEVSHVDGPLDIRVSCALGTLRVRLSQASPFKDCAPGKPACLVVKQEDIRVVTAGSRPLDPASENLSTLPLVQQVFHGDRLELLCRAGDQLISVYTNARQTIEGDSVSLAIAASEVHCIAV